uniref:CYP750C28 n=1 Tax=Taxus chinensis TaxID=29808 RepID=A0A291FB31_TAXCH|nr:CYP750C28 [Taxus chinensis]
MKLDLELPPWTIIFVTIFISFLVLWVFYVKFQGAKRRRDRLPPGPFSWPVIGNMHQLGKLPYRALQDLSHKYGPLMYLKLGCFPTVVVSSSEMAKEFLKTHDLAFASRPTEFALVKYLAFNGIIMAPYGAHWRHVRRLCVVELLSPKRIETYRSVREDEVLDMIRSIWKKSEQGTVPVNVSNSFASLTSSIIWRILSGTKFSDELNGSGLKEILDEVTATMGIPHIGDYIPSLDWLDLQGVKRHMKSVRRVMDAAVDKMIDQHVSRNSTVNSNNHHAKGFVDVLLEMQKTATADMEITRDHIKAIIVDIYAAGTDSTTSQIEWAMSELIRNPNIAKKVQDEIESVVGNHRIVTESDLAAMEYLQCVVKETLRLYPAGPIMVPHESTEACTVGDGYLIPEKTRVVVNAWAIGRDPKVWEDPLAFKPERLKYKNVDVKGQTDFDMIPFGTGRRGCPGAQLAMGTISLALAQLWHCFDWKIEGNPSELDMTETFGTVSARQCNLYVIPVLRIPSCL